MRHDPSWPAMRASGITKPDEIFTLSFFRKFPDFFWRMTQKLSQGNVKPTTSHYVVRLFEEKGILLRIITQNIDDLESKAGISSQKIVQSHGTFSAAKCLNVKCPNHYSKMFDSEWIRKQVCLLNCGKLKAAINFRVICERLLF